MSRRKILVADLLCGAGGSSTGCARALAELGLEMELVCVNHWGVAIETHRRNHPEARHYVQDIATVRPHLIVPEGYLDLLMASPTCTHHSVARGGKPTSDQQRSDPWHIVTWLTELRVRRIIIENVWEFCGWGPVDPRTGKPIKARRGEYFRQWIATLQGLGFVVEWRKLNAADYGDATTRQRFILMGRSDGRPIAWPVPSHGKREEGRLELFPTLQPWKPAREIIDWSLKGRSIFDRKKPLAPKTLARIYAGAVKFRWPEPFLVILRQHMAAQSVDGPLPTIAAHGNHIGVAEPVLLANRNNNAAKDPAASPVPCLTTAAGGGIAIVEPVIMNGRKGNQAKGVSTEPVPTLDTKGGVWLAEPLVLSQHNSGAARSADDPLPTVTTGGAGAEEHPGCARPMLAEPVIVRSNVHGRKSPGARGAEDPLPTITTDGGLAVAEPFILNRHGENGGVRAHSVEEPAPAADCRGAGYLAQPFIATVAHGNSDGDATADARRSHSVDEPLGALHAGGGKYGLVEPFLLSRQGEGAPRGVSEPTPTQVAKHSHVLVTSYCGASVEPKSAADPLPTVTTKDRFGIVVPVTHADGSQRARDVDADPLPTLTTANRGELAVIVASHGERAMSRSEATGKMRKAQAPQQAGPRPASFAGMTEVGQARLPVHDVDAPAPTICAKGRVDMAEGVIDAGGERYDILFRMLEPHELAAAMGFTGEDQAYAFAGTKTEQIKQIGNAVSVAKMKACVGAIMADAAPKATAARPAKRRAAA